MEEPELLTEEERAFIQQLYTRPESKPPEPLATQISLEVSLKDLLTSYATLKNLNIDVRAVNSCGNVQSIFPVYTESENLSYCIDTQENMTPQAQERERLKQLEAEVALLKTRLTDTFS
ncbi:hypothetical protein [Pseudomonas sp. M30-35]|uniref:hypothetical protein n=1 Tax=Pseudomonas sp. M30-35 TaxID=1981174 RepID=UPI000B3C77CD|nr:hypothetical protein [Pseudomonas sp. M30-35]ARU89569.1 hypothetical protein B9K09_17025 [Pseudomonas sp. M30-35]